MPIYITQIKLHAMNHNTAIFATRIPAWWEYLLLRFKKPYTFIGHKSSWKNWETMKPVPKAIAEQLQAEELRIMIQIRNKRR